MLVALLLSSAADAASRIVAAPSAATIAKVVVATDVRAAPGAGERLLRATGLTGWNGGPQWLLVLGRATGADGNLWLRVELPTLPNARDGWIRADHVRVSHTAWRVEISLARRRLSVYRGAQLVRSVPAVVGAPATPTPTGLFAVYDPVEQPVADGPLGPWALHLTAASEVIDGPPGRIAIHGRGGSLLRDPLGTARSSGCIRVDNDVLTWLARSVPRGTPVHVA